MNIKLFTKQAECETFVKQNKKHLMVKAKVQNFKRTELENVKNGDKVYLAVAYPYPDLDSNFKNKLLTDYGLKLYLGKTPTKEERAQYKELKNQLKIAERQEGNVDMKEW